MITSALRSRVAMVASESVVDDLDGGELTSGHGMELVRLVEEG